MTAPAHSQAQVTALVPTAPRANAAGAGTLEAACR